MILPVFPLIFILLRVMAGAGGNEMTHKLHKLKHCLSRASEDAVAKLFDQHTYPVYYNYLNQQLNPRIPTVFPIAYFLPSRTLDVQRLVRCGRDSRIPLVPNSGGHSYESLSFGSNSTVVIDFRNMRRIWVGKDRFGLPYAAIEPGALVGRIVAHLWSHGGYGIPMGTCYLVAIGGHAIGGGLGIYSQPFGPTVDSLVELEMVGADGEVVRANWDRNPDLYWALRGVGPGYIGIVTEAKFKVFEATRLRATYVSINYPVKAFDRVFEALQAWLAFTDRVMPYVRSGITLTSDYFRPNYPPTTKGNEVYLIHFWDPVLQPEPNSTFLAKAREYFPADGEFQVSVFSHLELLALTSYAALDEKPVTPAQSEQAYLAYLNSMRKGREAPLYFKIHQFFIKETIERAQLGRLQRLLQSIPNEILFIFEGMGGAIGAVPETATAFLHRRNKLYFSIQYEGPDEPEAVRAGMSWLAKFWKAAQFMDGGESYQNIPDLDDPNFLRRFYGKNLRRILEVKRTWDPKNYFRSPLSLPLKKERRARRKGLSHINS